MVPSFDYNATMTTDRRSTSRRLVFTVLQYVRRSVVALAFVAALTMSDAGHTDVLSDPMRARNLSPAIAIFGVPSWEGGLDGVNDGRFLVTGDLASHFRLNQRGGETLIFDGETWRVNFVYERRISSRWSLAAEVPVVRQWGGVLDDVVDGWHSIFNLPDGNRNLRPEGELEYRYDNGPGPGFSRVDSGTSLGDVMLTAALNLDTENDWLLKFAIKLPTGDEDLLAGSGETDVGVTLLRRAETRWRSKPAGWYWGAGVLRLGESEIFPRVNREWVGIGVFGLSWQPFSEVGFKAQLDAHTAFYDSALDELGRTAVLATLGGWWAIDQQRALTVAVVEDLIVRAAPDVSIQIGLDWTF
jgi:hypothetical protein